MNPQFFIPLLAVRHDYFGGALHDLSAFVWSGNVEHLRQLTPRLTVARGVVGLVLPREASPGPSLKDLCACLRGLPLFGWEMIPPSSDFATFTDWPYRLAQEHPLLELPPISYPSRESSKSARSIPPLNWTARWLHHDDQQTVPVLPQEEKPSPAMAKAWGNTQEKIIVRGRPSFSAFTTGQNLAALIEAALCAGATPRVPEANLPGPRAYWAYHISGYKDPLQLTIDDPDSLHGEPAAFVDLATDLPVGTRSFISQEPLNFSYRNAKAFRLRANDRDLIESLPVPSPCPLRWADHDQPVTDVFVHL